MIESRPILCEFEYRPNRLVLGLLLLLACGGEGLFIYFALDAPGGANLRGIELTQQQFRTLMAVLAALGPIGLACLAWPLVSSFRNRRRVALTAESIILPKPSSSGMSREEIELEFADIRGAEIMPFMTGTRLLVLYHSAGPVHIPSNMFKSGREFKVLAGRLIAAVGEPPKA